jgi:protein-S-isoprenylcysteine O-methyltransferase Ste14
MHALRSVTLGVWVVLELGMRIRERVQNRGGADRDRGTRLGIAVSLAGAFVLAATAAAAAPSLRLPGPVGLAGLVVLWAGLGVRVWAIISLGSAFRTTVEVDTGQAVVSAGPYARVRHPSYSGLLLIVIGFGLSVENWLSLIACLVVPLPAVLWRIRVEEAEMNRVLGDAYRVYQTRTERLIPGVW